jgi:hypothetical protein
MPLKMFGSRLKTLDTRSLKPPIRTGGDAAPYGSAEHKAWRKSVMERAGWRCEGLDDGVRCVRCAPAARLFADHIVELKDGGNRFDVANGRALCAVHHTLKTNEAKRERFRQP